MHVTTSKKELIELFFSFVSFCLQRMEDSVEQRVQFLYNKDTKY